MAGRLFRFLLVGSLFLASCVSAGSPIPDSEPIQTSTPTPFEEGATPSATSRQGETSTPTETATETATATKEAEKVHTQEELEAMVPTKEEMIAFVNSDEIVRIKDPLTQRIVPLGVKEITSRSGEISTGYSATINVLPWGEPVLADIGLDNGEPLRAMLVPAVVVQEGDFSKPVFLYVIAGEEGKIVPYMDIAYGEQGISVRGADTLTKLSYYIERGRQTEIYLGLSLEFFEPFNEQVVRDYLFSTDFPEALIESSIYLTKVKLRAGKSFLETAKNLRSRIPVEDGSVLGFSNIFEFQGIGHPYP